jgi:hypothetical protein
MIPGILGPTKGPGRKRNGEPPLIADQVINSPRLVVDGGLWYPT